MFSVTSEMQKVFEAIQALPTGHALSQVRQRYQDLLLELNKRAEEGNQISAMESQQILPYVQNIQVLCQAALQLEKVLPQSRDQLGSRIKAALTNEETTTHYPNGDDITNYDAWRQWYADHITHPYYDSRERDWLLQQIPGMTAQKVQTWFVNVRRRSGWTELYKKYADNKRENMEAIFRACDDPDPTVNEQVAPEARKLVAKVRQYLTLESKKTEIAPWLSDLLAKYKQATTQPVKSEDSDESSPFPASSASKTRKYNKRKAADTDSINTPSKCSKPSLYKQRQYPSTSASFASPCTPSKAPPAEPASTSLSTDPDLQTPPGAQHGNKEESPEQVIPPFAAWAPPAQPAFVQQASSLSSFVPAQAHAYPHTYALPPIQVQAPAQSFISHNNITYNVSPTSYAYPQLHQSSPVGYGVPAMHGVQGTSLWNQPPQWPQTYQYVEPSYYATTPSMSYSSPTTYNMVSNLSSASPSKRKYAAEEESSPQTPTGSYKRGRTSAYGYSEPVIVDPYSGLNAFSDHQGLFLAPEAQEFNFAGHM